MIISLTLGGPGIRKSLTPFLPTTHFLPSMIYDSIFPTFCFQPATFYFLLAACYLLLPTLYLLIPAFSLLVTVCYLLLSNSCYLPTNYTSCGCDFQLPTSCSPTPDCYFWFQLGSATIWLSTDCFLLINSCHYPMSITPPAAREPEIHFQQTAELVK